MAHNRKVRDRRNEFIGLLDTAAVDYRALIRHIPEYLSSSGFGTN